MNKYFNDGATVLFQGDSVTDWYRERKPDCQTMERFGLGYPRKFKEIYDILFPANTVNFVNRGISGNKIRDLIERYDEDFKAVKPDFISIMIGVNDTWHGFYDQNNTTVEAFERDYEALLQKIKSDMPDAEIMILEQFVIEAHPDRVSWKNDIDKKRAVTKRLAEKYADYFIPMHSIMNEAVDSGKYEMWEISGDGVHPAPIGFSLIAGEIMKTLGII